MNKRAWFGIVVALVSLMAATANASAQPERERHRPVKHPVLAASLLDEAGLVSASETLGDEPAQSDRRGRVQVAIYGDTRLIAAAVDAVGGAVDARAEGVLTAFIPRDQLLELSGAAGVGWIQEPNPMRSHVESAGVGETQMSAWHTNGQTGAGVTVGIVDVGFQGYQALLGTELPATVATHNLCANFQGDDHGTAVAEIVHDMAPEAALMLVCVENDVDIQAAANHLQSLGVRIVNASIGCHVCARGDGTGVSGSAMRQSRLANTLWSVSAGNSGDGHFNFTGTTRNSFDSVMFGPNNPLFSITVPAGGTFSVEVKWDAWPTTNQDYDLYLYASAASYPASPVTGSEGVQTGSQPPIEGFAFTNTGPARTFLLEIFAYSDDATPPANPTGRRFDLFVDGNFTAVESVTGGSVSEPATSPYVMTVGAYDVGTGAIEPFSSRGPTIDGRVKPDVAAPDNVATVELNPFFGTSAAAPHAAGAAAVLLAANPDLDTAELQAVIEGRSLDSGAAGLDNQFGFGRLRMGATGTPLPAAGDLYTGVDPPVRVVDTRVTSGCGFPTCGALGPGTQRVLTAAGQTFGGVTIPADATAIVFNVTAVSPTATGFVTVYPTGGARPTAANLTTRPGYTRGNHVTATVGQNGQVTFFNAAGNIHLVVDLAGWYSPSDGDVGLVPLNPPTRAVDTRPGAGCVGPQCSSLGPGGTLTLPIAGHDIGNPPLPLIPPSAQAVVLNVTVTSPTANGFITVWPGGDRPTVASLNFGPGQTVPNLVIATVGTGGTVSFYNGGNGSSHLIVDVLGYFDVPSNPAASRYVALNPPRRNLDTRFGNGPRLGPLAPSEVFNHQTRLLYGVPNDATAALMNISVSNPTLSGFLTVFPEGFARPRTANLNWLRGDVVPNAVISSIGATGRISLYNGGGGFTPIIVDLAGYYILV